MTPGSKPPIENKIYVDDREARFKPTLVPTLKRELGNANVITKRSDFGDIVFDGAIMTALGRKPTIAIEVCTVSDLVGKTTEGRLSFQLGNMMQKFDICYLLVESPIRADKDGYVITGTTNTSTKYDRLAAVLHGAQAHGVIVIYAADRFDTVNRILEIYHYRQKAEIDHKFFRPVDALRKPTVPIGETLDERVLALMSWPLVGEQRAIDALAHYHSIFNIVVAGEKGLKKIPGWGPATARNVHEFIMATEAKKGKRNNAD